MSNDEHILKTFNTMVTTLNNTKGTNAKIKTLQEYSELEQLIKRVWDPDTKTNVTKKGLDDFYAKKKDDIGDAVYAGRLYELFDALTARAITGDAAKTAVWKYINKFPDYQELILSIFSKTPRVRLGAAILVKAFPNMFKIFKVCLAQDYSDEDFKKEFARSKGKAWISKKIDGVRLITYVVGDEVTFYSRTGREWTSLAVLRDDVLQFVRQHTDNWNPKDGIVFDGELVALNPDGTENFKETVSQSRKLDLQMKNPRYKIFDMMDVATFEGVESANADEDYATRLARLQSYPDTAHCEVLLQTPYTDESFNRLKKTAEVGKWEGLMIRFNAPYERKRTPRLLKYKFMFNEEFVVVRITVEDMPFPNTTGGETVKRALKNAIILYKDCEVAVGSGFDKEERLMFAKDPSTIVGKQIMVQYQEPFYDDKLKKWSLRCPIYKGFIGEKREF